MASSPLLTTGIILKGNPSKASTGNIVDTDVSILSDSNGNLVFRDSFISEFLGKDYITLKDIYTKTQGVYVKDGNLYFKDSSVDREYSLQEIVNSFNSWKKNLKPGSLYWVGRTETDHRDCANLPKTESVTDLNKIYWSVDRYIQETTGLSPCSPLKPITFLEKTKTDNNEWKWYDVQNLQIVVPPIEDKNKLAIINVKLAFNQKKSDKAIVFRLYDATAGVELTRAATVQANNGYVSFPIGLFYFGALPLASFTAAKLADTNNTSLACATEEDCGCTTVDCVDTDVNCFIPNQSYVSKTFAANSHLIKVQFYISDYHTNHWDRYFGADIDTQSASKSSIDVAVFDATPSTKYVRKHGTASFNKTKTYTVTFDVPLDVSTYSVTFSSDTNINVWYTNKTKTGFIIESELEFQGNVDWTLLNIN